MSQGFKAFPCKDRIVLVTGGGSGIGLGLAQKAIQRGARGVHLADPRLSEDAAKWMAEVEDDRVSFHKCDVTKWQDLTQLPELVEKEFGDVPDIWIPAAGIFEPKCSNFWEDSETKTYASVQIDTVHPIKLTRIAIRALLSHGKQGVVLLISSDAGLYAHFPAPIYVATKHAIVGFGRALGALDPKEGIKVMTICPGNVWTPMLQAKAEDWGVTAKDALSLDEFGNAVFDLVESQEVPGGSVYQIHKDWGCKVVPAEPHVLGDISHDEVFAMPEVNQIQALLKRERRN